MKPVFVAFLLLLFTVAGGCLRFYKLANIPSGVIQDEVVATYDVYSLMTTGHDHHGVYWPVTLQSFNDWVTHIIILQFIPAIILFGKDTVSLRQIAAAYSTVSIPLMFLLGNVLTGNILFGLSIAAMYSFSQYSMMGRWGHPSIVILYISISIYLFIRAMDKGKKQPILWIIAGIAFGCSIYNYPSLEGFIMVWLVFVLPYLFLIRKKEGLETKNLFMFITVFGIVSLPLFFDHISHPYTLLTKFHMDSLGRYSRFPVMTYFQNYLLHLSPYSLFIPAEKSPIRVVPGFAYENIAIGALYYLGLFVLFFRKKLLHRLFPRMNPTRINILIASWLLYPAVPSAFVPAGDYQRIPYVIPIILVLAGFGIYYLYYLYTKISSKNGKYLISVCMLLWFVVYIQQQYLFLTNFFSRRYAEISQLYCQYNLGSAIKYAAENEDKYSSVVIDELINQPYIYVLYYKNVSPSSLTGNDYRDFSSVDTLTGWSRVKKFRNYTFRQISPEEIGTIQPLKRFYNSPVSQYGIYKKGDILLIRFELTSVLNKISL